MDILAQIVAHTRETLSCRMQKIPLAEKRRVAESQTRSTLSLRAKLEEQRPHVIAEFKRKSPSKPSINLHADPIKVALAYEKGGASAISVLTEPHYFMGDLQDLALIREQVSLPLLRKDFMIDPYQFYEAREHGADLVLLIARILEPAQIADYTLLAHDLGLEVLCEIHEPEELERIADAPIDFLGLNCRNLSNFSTNLSRLVDLATQMPEIPLVAESGIHDRDDLQLLYRVGYKLFLVGEHLMRDDEPEQRLLDLLRP